MTRSKKVSASKANETKETEAMKIAPATKESASAGPKTAAENDKAENKVTEAPNPDVQGNSTETITDLAGLSATLTSDTKSSPVAETRSEAMGSLAAALQPQDEEDLIVVVIGPKGGFWRAGRHFTPDPTRILASELSDEEAAMLRDEPKLAISLMKADAAG